MRNKKHILHSVPSLSVASGGPARSVTQLCASLLNENLNIDLITAVDGDEQLVEYDRHLQVMTVRGQNMTMFGRLFAESFHRYLEQHNKHYDVIHQSGMWLKCSHETTKFAHEKNIPIVLSPRGMVEVWALNYRRHFKKIAWSLFQRRDMDRVTAFHATSKLEAENLRNLGLRQPICVIPNGIELPPLQKRKPKSAGKEKKALFLSRINPKKGIPMLLDAWQSVKMPGWKLIIAGNDDSDHLPIIEEKLARLRLQNDVVLHGPAYGPDKHNLLLEADLFILPSYSENFGIVVAEALSYSLPVLTTTGCPWKELETYDCGWWIDPSLSALEKALRQVLETSGEELVNKGRRGRLLAEEHYQWPAIANDMRLVYDWLLGDADRPSCMYDELG